MGRWRRATLAVSGVFVLLTLSSLLVSKESKHVQQTLNYSRYSNAFRCHPMNLRLLFYDIIVFGNLFFVKVWSADVFSIQFVY